MSAALPPGLPFDNRGPGILAAVWTFTIVGLFTTVCRLYGRLKLTSNAGKDDLVIAISQVFIVVYSILCTCTVVAGFGRHTYDLGPKAGFAIEMSIISFVPGIITVVTPKLAVACLLIRLLNPSRKQIYFLYTLTISCIIVYILCAIFLWIQCRPSAMLWDPTVEGTCWDPSVFINYCIFCGSYSAFVDLYLALYPLSILYTLQINKKKKIGLSLVLGLGIIATVAAIWKTTVLPDLYNHADFTYALSDLLIWSSVEPNTILIAANLPTLRPIFLLVTGQQSTVNSKSAALKGSHRLSSMGGPKPRSGSGARELFPTDTVNLVQGDNAAEQGLYERHDGGIWKTSTTSVKTELAGSAEQPWDPESGTVVGKRSAERKW
ncbi:hypothetical protein MMC30_004817 [Trapelia coarctata]|nr:hypothetical protein [Trapelia coarctata]